ncbi:hypothetical protein KXS11_11970 [Plantibacter flavus]|uniref:hypothetical protein n=1 Tax=Plantibacter flavus TaxID=150123 RepID=UPI003F13FC54
MVTKHARQAVSLDSSSPVERHQPHLPYVVPIGARQWRISNGNEPGTPDCCLAYVEGREPGFDVLIVAPSPPEWVHVDTFEEAKNIAIRRPSHL